MPFDCYWMIEDHVLLIEAYGDLTIEDFQELITTEYQTISPQHKVHAIMLTDGITSAPPVREFATIKQSKTGGYVVFITSQMNIITRFMASTSMRLMNMPIYIMSHMDGAQAKLRQLDTLLQDTNFPTDITNLPYVGRIGRSDLAANN